MVQAATEFEVIDAFLLHGLAVERISQEITLVKGMNKATLTRACANQPLFSPTYCKQSYLRQLKRLLARFQFAPDSLDDFGLYLGDLQLLLWYTKKLIEAGLQDCILVDFKPKSSSAPTSRTPRTKRTR